MRFEAFRLYRLAWWAENLTECFLKERGSPTQPRRGLEGRLEIGQRTAMSKRPDLAPHLQICTHQLEPACEPYG